MHQAGLTQRAGVHLALPRWFVDVCCANAAVPWSVLTAPGCNAKQKRLELRHCVRNGCLQTGMDPEASLKSAAGTQNGRPRAVARSRVLITADEKARDSFTNIFQGFNSMSMWSHISTITGSHVSGVIMALPIRETERGRGPRS